MNALQMDEAEKARRMDTLQYQITELERAKLQPGEEEELQSRRNLLRNAEKFISAVAGADYALNGGDDSDGVLNLLRRAQEALGAVRHLDEGFAALYERLESAYSEVYDIADAVAEQIHAQDAKLKKDVAAMRAIQSKLSVLPGQCEDPVTATCLTQLAEEIRFSDPVSSEATQETEADLNALTDELQKAVLEHDTAAAQNLCKRCQAVLMERNRLCKLEKCSASGDGRT